jgi:hypothetical protein
MSAGWSVKSSRQRKPAGPRLEPVHAGDTTPRRPDRYEVVTHVIGTSRYRCVRAGHFDYWRATNDDDEHYVYAIAL